MSPSGSEPPARPIRAARAALSAAVALVVAGCNADDGNPYFGSTTRPAKDVATFYSNTSGEPEYLDPGKAADTASAALIDQLFEGLASTHPGDTHPVPGVATSFERSADNRLYRFHLRDDAKWSDGRPVTAGDFEYAWKRVLRPATASRAATLLHVVENGELFNRGLLRVVTHDLTLRAGPSPGAAAGAPLPKGAAVEVLSVSPRRVTTAVAPIAAVPPGVRVVNFSKADAKKGTPEQLSLGAGLPPLVAAPGNAWKDAEVEVLAAGPEVDCDTVADRWLLVQRGAERGYLPGCVLGKSKDKTSLVLVERHEQVPTFRADAPPPAEGAKVRGFMAEADLAEDDRVLGVRAVDDRTFEVELEHATPYFLDLITQPVTFPVRRDVVEAFEKRGDPDLWTRPESIVTNGPYTLSEHKFRYEITMVQNPHYWNRDKLRIHRIVWMEIEDYHPAMNLYKAGEFDYIGDNTALPAEYQPLLRTKKDYRNNVFLSVYWYTLNTRKPPLDDARVRRALNLAIDKKLIVEKITRGGQMPATHVVPDFTGLGYSDEVKAQKAAGTDIFSGPGMDYDPALARSLMKEAGYDPVEIPGGYRADRCPPIEILYNTNEGHRNIAVAVQDMWKRNLGVTATLRNEEFKVLLKNYRDGNFNIVRGGWQAEFNHPQTFLNTFLSSSPENQTGWADPAFDAAVKEAAATADPKESMRAYRKAEALAMAGMARIPFYFYTRSTLIKPWVKGFVPIPRGQHLIQYLWIDPDGVHHEGNDFAYVPTEFAPPGVYAP
ncbi:MAG: peptide ABC transporter substrate-binding protein [Byssovorax sp.]